MKLKTAFAIMGVMGMMMLGLIIGLMYVSSQDLAKIDDPIVAQADDNNVGNGEAYEYRITQIGGNEVNGVAINKKSSDNVGIFLYADEIPFDVKVGDKISIVWGEYEDEFQSIKKASDDK